MGTEPGMRLGESRPGVGDHVRAGGQRQRRPIHRQLAQGGEAADRDLHARRQTGTPVR